jgi:hypothetical protein
MREYSNMVRDRKTMRLHQRTSGGCQGRQFGYVPPLPAQGVEFALVEHVHGQAEEFAVENLCQGRDDCQVGAEDEDAGRGRKLKALKAISIG